MKLKEFKEFKKHLKVGKVYYNCEVFKKLDLYFRQSSKYKEKTKYGLKGYVYDYNRTWGNKNICIFVIDNYNNRISFSENIFKESTSQKEVTKAFRTAIYPEIKKYKRKFIENVTKCAISGYVIGRYENMHVDHYDDDFVIVVDLFLKKYNKTFDDLKKYVVKEKSLRRFNNEKLIKYFIEFHNSHTNLRFVCKEENLKRRKIFL